MAQGPVKILRTGKDSVPNGEKTRPLYQGLVTELAPAVATSVAKPAR